MALIAQNHLQFIVEVGILMYAAMIFLLNLAPLSLSMILFLCLVLGIGFNIIFGLDVVALFMSFGQSEFTHPFGPIALLVTISSLAALAIMEDSGVEVGGLRGFVYILMAGITVFGGLMHRSFLLLWLLGLLIGFFLISKSMRQRSIITVKRVLGFAFIAVAGFGGLELLSRILQMPVLSPLLRIERLETFSLPSLKLVLKNTALLGHNPMSSYWGELSSGFADGYISLPLQLILFFGLPFPVFYGILVNKKDVIDYMVPGIFGWAYDFGYITMVFLLIWCVGIIIMGLRMLYMYRDMRENGSKTYLGREVLLTGALAAFMSQALIGLFIINRTINGTALMTFIFLSSLIFATSFGVKE